MEKIYGRTKTIQEDKVSGFCPGCMHSTVIKLIGEVLEEMDLVDRAACVLGIGCCGLHMDYIAYDNTTAPHGRACAVATGMKRSNPDSLVFTYQGDGDFASIGLAESISAANRGENITVIFINNGIYGMTGGQMAPTTLPHQKTATSPRGKDPARYGTLNVVDVLGKMDIAYLARGELVGPAGMNNCKKLIRKALDHFRAQTIYLIIGLMLGSIYAVVMGPTTLEVPQPAMTLHDFNILFFVIGGALIIGLQKMKDLKA